MKSPEEFSIEAMDLDASAMAAYNAYYSCVCEHKTGKFPKRDARKSRNWRTFIRIAEDCKLNSCDVTRFVQKAFAYVYKKHTVVTPSDVANVDHYELFHKPADVISGHADPSELWTSLSVKIMDIVFSSGVKGKKCREFLDDPIFGFPAWFRVFFPVEIPRDIIVHWGDLALEELVDNPALDAYLQKRRPGTYDLLKTVVREAKGNK